MQSEEQQIIDKMSTAIFSMLKDYQLTEPVYSVILTYSTQTGEEFPPWVAVGTERERAAFIKQEPENANTLLWDGEVLEIYDPVEALLEDMDFMDACAAWSIEVHKGEHAEERITALMQRLCFALQAQDWSSVFPVTKDFVVTACTAEGDWLDENMRILLTDEQYANFVQNGYILPMCGCGE